MRVPPAAFALVLALPFALQGSLAPSTPAPPLPMQADPDAPVWAALRDTGLAPAQWAVLLTSDADGNGRTDFLDLVLLHGAANPTMPVELLVYGTAAARANLLRIPGAVAVPAAEAVFITVPLGDVPRFARPGVSLLVWEPRAYAAASSNPAGGSPSSMPQNSITQAGTAWATYTGSGVTIAIIDTGVDSGHQALDGGKVTAWKDCVANAASAYDDHGHGTHVASIAAGEDGTDFKGVAHGASVNGVKILDSNGSGSLAWFQCGVNWVKSGGTGGAKTADVASMSAGLAVPPLAVTTLNGGPLDLFGWDSVADQLPAADIPFTVAAGNWLGTLEFSGIDETLRAGVNGVNQVSSPGHSAQVLTVGAVDSLQAPGTFTALGPGELPAKPDVVAHGVATWGALEGTTSLYEQWSGTSMATPAAAGVVALLMDKTSGLSHVTYENAVRNGARPACVYATTPSGCVISEPPANWVAGRGVVKANNSLAYV
jgi:subtilisin family serine protease